MTSHDVLVVTDGGFGAHPADDPDGQMCFHTESLKGRIIAELILKANAMYAVLENHCGALTSWLNVWSRFRPRRALSVATM